LTVIDPVPGLRFVVRGDASRVLMDSLALHSSNLNDLG
jgi:hypothetical protein